MHHDNQQADPEARFLGWFEQHQGLLFKVIRSHEANPEDQQDLLQEILLQLWNSLGAYRGQCSETTWIYRVALNTAYTWCRNEKRRSVRQDRIIAFAEVAATTFVDSADNQYKLEALYSTIRDLPKAEAALIIMHLDGMSGREMAEVIGLTENHVGVKLSRARQRLHDLLQENLD